MSPNIQRGRENNGYANLTSLGWSSSSNTWHCAKKPVTTMLTYPWKCTVLPPGKHLETTGADDPTLWLLIYCPSASKGDNQNVGSSAPVVSRCFPGGYNVKLYISRGRLAWWLLAFLHSAEITCSPPVWTVHAPGTVYQFVASSLTEMWNKEQGVFVLDLQLESTK